MTNGVKTGLVAVAVGCAAMLNGATTTCAVDFTQEGAVRPIAPAAIGYAPHWAAEAGTSVELLVVTHIGQENCSTQTLVAATADGGESVLTMPEVGSCAMRLIMRSLDDDRNVVGEFVKDISLATRSDLSDEAFADTTAEKLDRVAADKKSAATLAISRSWVEGAASVVLEHIETPVSGEPVVTQLYRGTVPASETYTFVPFGSKRSACQCKLHFYDANGVEIGTPLTADYDGRITGLLLILK